MKLISILRCMDDGERIEVLDDSAPIDKMTLFQGRVFDCKKQGYFRNGVVTSMFCADNGLVVAVDIEYQKKKRGEQNDKT